ncbi:MAG: DUF4129 domain-containing protein [Brevefilum sp.]|nr:DUF4129 domain-containing protein [Brevefilum sp.]
MSENRNLEQKPLPQNTLLTLNFLLVSVMLTCFAFIISSFLHIIAPPWGLYWFPILAFIVSLITLIARYGQQKTPGILQNKALSILVEILLIALIAKLVSLVSMLPRGWSSIWVEILSWPKDFPLNFFDLDFMLRSSGLFLIWILAWFFSLPLIQLEEDHALMEQEKLGVTFTDRYKARRSLIGLIFSLGIVMIILLGIWKSSLPFFFEEPIPTTYLVVILLAYFFTAFVFLALNQYVIMKARWYFNDIPVSPKLAQHWLFYSLVFISLVIVVIILLPTNLPLNFSQLAQWLAEAITFLVTLILSILIAPVALLISFLGSLLNVEVPEETVQRTEPEMIEMLSPTLITVPWWDVVKSILFWIVFLTVVIFAIAYYLRDKPNLLGYLRGLKVASWMRNFWQWLVRGFKTIQKTAEESFQKGIDSVNTFLRRQKLPLPPFGDLAKFLPPRQAVILVYTDWVQWNQQHGFERKPSQTPLEYAQAYHQRLPEMDDLIEPLKSLTDVFIQARYSRRTIVKAQAKQAQSLSHHLKKSFNPQDIPQNPEEGRP